MMWANIIKYLKLAGVYFTRLYASLGKLIINRVIPLIASFLRWLWPKVLACFNYCLAFISRIVKAICFRLATAFSAHPKIWIFNIVFIVGGIVILTYAFMQKDEAPVYIVSESDEFVVILDLGHGGRDPGAVVRSVRNRNGSKVTIYEHGMVFDVGARLIQLLKNHRNIAVLPTVTDQAGEVVISETDIPLPPQKTFLYTEPPCDLNNISTSVAVNMRWILANYHKHRLQKEKSNLHMIFLSLHMDLVGIRSGGLTVYTPGSSAELIFPENEEDYLKFMEAREWRRIMADCGRDQGAVEESITLARRIVSNFRRHHLTICPEKTYRNRVLMDRRPPFVPAVLRYNMIDTRVMLELANLGDWEDQLNVLDPLYRERMAWAIYEAIIDTFSDKKPCLQGFDGRSK